METAVSSTRTGATDTAVTVDYTKSRPLAERRVAATPIKTAVQAAAQEPKVARVPMRIGESARRAAPLQGRMHLERCELLRDAILPGFAGKLKIWLAITGAAAAAVWILSLSGSWTGLAELGLIGSAATAVGMARKYQADRSPWRLQARR